MINIKRIWFWGVSITFFNCFSYVFSQEINPILFPQHLSDTYIAKLKTNDSLIYYQCHVAEAAQELTTSTGEKIKSKPQKFTITEKYTIIKSNRGYRLKYSRSSICDYPNKKFAYLKLKEKKYWEFTPVKDTLINEHDVLIFAAFEKKSHDTTEYDFKVTKYSSNQLIIIGRKIMRQLIVDGDYLLNKNLTALK